jgi:hypothetical protein
MIYQFTIWNWQFTICIDKNAPRSRKRLNSIPALKMMKRTAHQERIIRNYYRNQDAIMLQKLGDLIGEVYLAEGKARSRVWERIATALKNLEVPESQIQHLVESDNPTLAANLLKQLLEKK